MSKREQKNAQQLAVSHGVGLVPRFVHSGQTQHRRTINAREHQIRFFSLMKAQIGRIGGYRPRRGRTVLSMLASSVTDCTSLCNSHTSRCSTDEPGSSLLIGPSDSISSMSSFVKV